MQSVIDNPRSGERIVIRRSGPETGGQLLEFDLFLQPGGHVPAGHVHPRQEERFSVLSGWVRFRIGRRTVFVRPGETVVVPRGTAHWFGNSGTNQCAVTVVVPRGTAHWFGNSGTDLARLRVEVRPALRMQELFESSVERSLSTSSEWWTRLIDRALILLDFQQEVGVPHVPARLVTSLLTPLAWLRLRFAR